MSSIFEEKDVDRLIEIMGECKAISEAKLRADVSRKKLIAGMEADASDEELELLIKGCSAAIDAEMRLIIHSMKSQNWMLIMREKIEIEKPELAAKVELMVRGMI